MVFFFKQKTAYEMRISDWSSDVCSSDLCYAKIISYYEPGDRIVLIGFSRGAYTVRALANMMNLCGVPTQLPNGAPIPRYGPARAEEHTSELQSLMPISYTVFCWTKNNINHRHTRPKHPYVSCTVQLPKHNSDTN